MVLKTKLTEILGIEHPIICGGMHWVGFAELAAAVSNAGGLGTITAITMQTPEGLRKEIRKVKSLTNKPFAVNLTILPALLPADYGSMVNVICEEKVPVIEISGGNPKTYIKQLKAAGVKVIHKSATIKHAKNASKAGVDIIEIAGFESSVAGRKSDDDVGTWVILAKALEEIKDTPIVVSGASATGRQLAGALAMGAHGITMGTRFMVTDESLVGPQIKEFLASPEMDEFGTTLILKSFQNATRVAKNKAALEVLKIEKSGKGFSALRPLVQGQNAKTMFLEGGDKDMGTFSCGQSVGLINDIPTCKALIDRVVADAERNLRASAACVSKL
eukprot:TRINITY_DN12642_c0_g1_i1.p1 TRINITY_DN12642_c0_g1~~TRINITY_DN12642_c0_g1_i1.p1  ORF type:complete len:332 (+),score=82.45 TRINITY_DN12642_c0_g1_i1:49-1044(+)